MKKLAATLLLAFAALPPTAAAQDAPTTGAPITGAPVVSVPMTSAELAQIATDAYRYFYPIVTMDVTRRQMIGPSIVGGPVRAPMNAFANMRSYPPASLRVVVRPNFDTLYSMAWLDLTEEPVIVSAPDTDGRYYLLEMLDMWSDAFAAPGKRTTGTQAISFAVTPRGWTGTLPEGVSRISAPTRYVWVLGRTQTNGPADYDAVHRIQDGYRITPLSQWGKATGETPAPAAPAPAAQPAPDYGTNPFAPPLQQVNSMPAARFFEYGHALMRQHGPHLTDWSLAAQLRRIGFDMDRELVFANLPANVQAALQAAAATAPNDLMAGLTASAPVVNGWEMNVSGVGVYGNDYRRRAITAMVALGANQPEDAVYPIAYTDSFGRPLDGAHRYVLHFGPGEAPPVNAFWSLTVYDAQGFPADNQINRYALGSKDPLAYNADGSLDLYIQQDNPGADKQTNWLPAPQGQMSLTLRLYWPQLAVLDKQWNPPAVRRAGDPAF